MLSAESTDKKITQKCEIWARPTEQCLPRVLGVAGSRYYWSIFVIVNLDLIHFILFGFVLS